MSDDYDDIIDEIRKFFKFNSKLFDLDFIIFPKSRKDLESKDKNIKGFKISYHYEKGMDKPDINFEGNLDEKDISKILNNFKQDPIFLDLGSSIRRDDIDASHLSLEFKPRDERVHFTEPYTEIKDCEDFCEIIFEVPGIEKGDIIISFNEDGSKLTFSARSKNRNYHKHLSLPFKSSLDNYSLELNNYIAILKVRRLKS